ncbi:MAG: ATP-grasp fold amidoligase family protein [Filifactor alocis]|nr:ATP-grasp fold amidoligase family protein [Filifactor alocis]
MKTNYYYSHREWPYKNVKPRIIAEKLMKDDADTEEIGLMDYKFYCFNGEPKYLYISLGFSGSAFSDEGETRISFLDMDWKFAPFGRADYKGLEELPKKPSRFDEMVELARLFSKGHRFLRVDLYQINEEIYFSEFTFTPSAGYMPFSPVEYERILGDEMIL